MANGENGDGKKPDEAGPATTGDDDLEDEFAAFEREAKEAAAKAAAAMGGGASDAPAPSADPEPAGDDAGEDELDEEDEFAAFEREAKEAAAKAAAAMGGGASGAATSDAPASPAGPAGDDSAAPAETDDGAEGLKPANKENPGKLAALEAAAKSAAANAEKLFAAKTPVKSQTILVVGGGIAGVTAALEAAETGYEVVLLEKGPALGGRVTRLNRYFPKLCHPNCGLEINYQRIRANRRLKVVTMAEVAAIAGTAGDFTVSIRTQPTFTNGHCNGCGDCVSVVETQIPNPYNYAMDKIKAAHLPHEHAFPMSYVMDPSLKGTEEARKIAAACPRDAIDFDQKEETFELSAGAIIWATGWKPYDAEKLEVYSYGHSPDIINNVEMERLASHDGPTQGKILRPSDGEPARKVALIQCAGSRDINHLAYCSMICCLASLKHAAYIREQYDDAEVDIYYIDIRAHDKMSGFYERVRADEKINFIKSKPGHIMVGEDGRPVVCGERTIERELYQNPYDLVVLATGMEPSLALDFAPDGLVRDDYGFVVDDGGQFAAGVAGGPFDVALSTQSATAAALKAIQTVRGARQ